MALQAAISPTLQQSLRATGELPVDTAGPDALIGPQQARMLALAFIRRYGKYDRDVLEHGFGAPIDFAELTVQAAVQYVHTPYEAVDARFARTEAKALGSYYLVTLLSGGVQAISVAVSALASDLSVANGRIITPLVHGNEFRWLPIRRDISFPIRAEQAVALAFEATGGVASDVPTLVGPTADHLFPHYARWRIVTDRALPEGGMSRDTVYVSWGGQIQRRSERHGTLDRRRLALSADRNRTEEVLLIERPGFARHLSNLDPSGRGQ